MNKNYKKNIIIFRSFDRDRLRTLHINSKLMSSGGDKAAKTYSLYPYDSIELVVLFFYGNDFKRQLEIFIVPESIQIAAGLFMLFVILAASILCFIRRKLRLRRDGLFSTFIDTMVAFIAGGTLQMRHKLERWFFGILLTSALFITALWTGDVLDCLYQMDKKITTFQQLADINSPIFIPTSFKGQESAIHEMLR